MQAEITFKSKSVAGVCDPKKAPPHPLRERKSLDKAVDELQCGGANVIIWPIHIAYVNFYISDPRGTDMLGLALILA